VLSAQSTLARLKISTSQAWKLFVNQTLIRAGDAARDLEVAFPLARGTNEIVVEAQSGAAQLDLTPPGFVPSEPIAWLTSLLASDAKPVWKTAPQQNGVVGMPGAPVRLRHTLLWNATPYYPMTDPAFYIAEGTAQQMTFLAEGVPGQRLDDWRLLLAVPPEFEVIGATGFYGKLSLPYLAGKPTFQASPIGETTIAGQKMKLYQVVADKPIIHKSNAQDALIKLEVFFRLAPEAKHDPSREWRFYFWSRGNGNTVSEAPRALAVRTAPLVRGKQAKKLAWEFWTSYVNAIDDRELLHAILATSRQAGFNKFEASGWKDFNDIVRGYGMKAWQGISLKDSRFANKITPYLAAHPDEKLVDKTGKQVDNYMCTTKLLGENWPMVGEIIQTFVRDAALDAVDYDYELSPFNPPHACFCERCLKEFRRFSQLDNNLELTPSLVQEKYSSQWINFMAWRAALILGKMKGAVHAGNPNAKLTSYSGYYDAKENSTKSHYGIDWNIVGQMQAVDEIGVGYGRPVPTIAETIAALRGIPVKFGELLTPYDVRSMHPVAPLRHATLLRRALDATGGVLIYERPALDGRSWYALGETTRLVADFEELFIAHRLESIPGQAAASVQILKGDNCSLVCVMNESSKPADFRFRLPAALGGGREYYSGLAVAAGEEVQLTLEGGAAAVYVLRTK
jgi:hypothetical protein